MNTPDTVCRDVVDSSGCWNRVVGPNGSGTATEVEAKRLWECVPGGKDTVSYNGVSPKDTEWRN